MKWLQILSTIVFCFLCIGIKCHSQVETREYWQNNQRLLLCKDERANKFFAMEMATGNLIAKPEASQMWDSSNMLLGNLSSVLREYYKDTFSVQRNTWCAWNNCALNLDLRLPAAKVSLDKDNRHEVTYAGKVTGFDDMLKREKELVNKWKKEDKKQSVNRWYHSPVLRYDTTHHRVFMVGYSGIAWVSEDSLDNGAHQVLGEVPGLRLQSIASPQYHRYIFLLYMQSGVKDFGDDIRTVCRVFDTYTMKLLKLPDSDKLIDPGFVFCPTGDYVLAIHQRVVAPWQKFWPVLINLNTWKKEGEFLLRGSTEHMRFYLHRNLLFLNTAWHLGPSSVWVVDLLKEEKEIFRYDKKQ